MPRIDQARPPPGIKGTALIDLVKLARKNRAAFEVELPQETKDFLEERVLASSWYPESHLASLLGAADRIFGGGDLAYCLTMGRFITNKDVHSGVYAGRIVKGDPQRTLEKMSLLWPQYHNTGRASIVCERGSSTYEIRDFGLPSAALCKLIEGMILEGLSLCGVEGARVEHDACRLRNDPSCRYRIRWS